MKEQVFVIAASGELLTIYSDSLAELFSEGHKTVRRASHVEPDENGMWIADLAPVGGPKLPCCALRADALAAEIAWLQENLPTLRW